MHLLQLGLVSSHLTCRFLLRTGKKGRCHTAGYTHLPDEVSEGTGPGNVGETHKLYTLCAPLETLPGLSYRVLWQENSSLLEAGNACDW